jgi:phosphoserine phosphatase RsbU/P
VCSAGHLPPLLCTREGVISELSSPGNVPIGVFDDSRYSETEHLLQPGDRVLLYTDGVTEAMNRSGEMFGTERFKQVLRAEREESPESILAAVEKAVAEHAAGVPQSDDLAMVCLAVDG